MLIFRKNCIIKKKLNLVLSELQNLFSFEYSVKNINQENWNSTWEKNFEPVEINEQCVIRNIFMKKLIASLMLL